MNTVRQQKLLLLDNIDVIASGIYDYDYLLYESTQKYIVKRTSPKSNVVKFVVYYDSATHPVIGNTFEFNPRRHGYWHPYKITDKSMPTIEEIKQQLIF